MDSIRLLMEHGGNPNLALNDGSTPLMMMAGLGARGGFDEEVRLGAIRTFWIAGAAVDPTLTASGDTALHIAAQRGAERIVDFLVAAGASLHRENNDGQTPSDLAFERSALLVP